MSPTDKDKDRINIWHFEKEKKSNTENEMEASFARVHNDWILENDPHSKSESAISVSRRSVATADSKE
jgi:hypothetical protein